MNKMNKISFKKNSKKLKYIAIILALTFLVVLIWVNRINFAPSNVSIWIVNKIKSIKIGTGFPYNIKNNKILPGNLKLIGDNIIILSSSSFISANLSMKKIYESQHNFAHPFMKTKDLRAIIFDLGGKNFKIQSLVGEIFSGKTEKEIIACDISENGNYVVVTKSQIYLAELIVYDIHNKERYKYFFSDCNVSDVALSSDGKMVAVCGVSSENVYGSTNIYFLDPKSETPKNIIKISENFIYSINFFENGNLEIIGDKFASVINPQNSSCQDFNFENMELKFFDFNKKVGTAFCLLSNTDKIGNTIAVVDENGIKRFFEFSNENFVSISLYPGKVAALGQNFFKSYSLLASKETTTTIGNGFKKLILMSSSRVCLLGAQSIIEVKI